MRTNRLGLRVRPIMSPTHAPTTAPRTAVPRSRQIDPTQAEFEARAKILWGDPPREVTLYLMSQGFSYEDASDIVDAMFQERVATLRATGIKKIIAGFALMAVPVVAYLIFLSVGYILIKTFLFTIVAGLCGLAMFIGGWFSLLAPKSQTGDVAEQ